MAGRLLLDTSIVIDLFAGEEAVQRILADSEEVFLPSIAAGELFYGASVSARAQANLAQIEAFVSAIAVLPCDLETARRYGEIKALLRAKGRPLPENDIWIAAQAQQHDLMRATRDRHFHDVEGLSLVAWQTGD